MTRLDRKLAMLASLTGNDPIPPSYKKIGLNCSGIYCTPCPFFNKSGDCNGPDRKSKDLEIATIRTHKDALNNYPEYFL